MSIPRNRHRGDQVRPLQEHYQVRPLQEHYRNTGDEEDGGVMGDAQGGAGAGTAFTAGGKAGGGGTSSPMLILRSTGDSFASGRRRGHASGAGPTIQCFCWPGDWSTCHVKVGSGGQAVALTPRATSRCCRSACSNQPDKCSSPSVKLRFMRRRGKAHHRFFFYLSKVCSITFVRNFFIFPKFCSNFLF